MELKNSIFGVDIPEDMAIFISHNKNGIIIKLLKHDCTCIFSKEILVSFELLEDTLNHDLLYYQIKHIVNILNSCKDDRWIKI